MAKRVEAQKSQTGMLDSIKERKQFNSIRKAMTYEENVSYRQQEWEPYLNARFSKYYRIIHQCRPRPAYGKPYGACEKLNHFLKVYRSVQKQNMQAIVNMKGKPAREM